MGSSGVVDAMKKIFQLPDVEPRDALAHGAQQI